jgi:hypothetical protein
LNKDEIYTLLVKKEKIKKMKPENLNKYVNESLNKNNTKINSYYIISDFLVKIFSPISYLIEKSPDVELIKIEDKEIEKVISNIEKIFNLTTFINTFAYI